MLVEQQAPNGFVKPLNIKLAIMQMDSESKLNFGKQNIRDFADDMGALVRLALSKCRELKKDAVTRNRCYTKAFLTIVYKC